MPRIDRDTSTDTDGGGVVEVPEGVRPYLFHGVDLDWKGGRREAPGDCPFCAKEGKFGVEAATSKFNCFACGTSGNSLVFIRRLWEESFGATKTKDYDELARRRKLLDGGTLVEWGAARSVVDGTWMLPGYDAGGKICNLYRYEPVVRGGKPILKATPGMHHGLFRPSSWSGKGRQNLTEGPWDGMALWEAMRVAKRSGSDGESLSLTANLSASLLAEEDVLGCPGANSFKEEWCPLFQGRELALYFDSDHPRRNPAGGGAQEPVGAAGMRRTIAQFGKAGHFPEEVQYLWWGEQGYDPDLPSGYDVRDFLSRSTTPAGRVEGLGVLLGRLREIPVEWVPGAGGKAKGSARLDLIPCTSWEEVRGAWRKAMKWPQERCTGLDGALVFMLAISTAVMMIDVQLWGKVIGPPSCGKSELCKALFVSEKYVKAVSLLTGFHSGFKSDKSGDEDHSLAAKLHGKTLVIKDGDTLVNAPNKEQTLAEARDLFDTTSSVHYKHGVNRDYKSNRFGFILCGTESLREIDQSELGQRFFDYVIVDRIDQVVEVDIARKRVGQLLESMGTMANCSQFSNQLESQSYAMRITAGYLEYLREEADRLTREAAVGFGEVETDRVINLARFITYLRARPSKKQDEAVVREMSTRLASQLVKLACCIGAVLNKRAADPEVMGLVRKVAVDTSRGKTLDMCRLLYAAGPEGLVPTAIRTRTGVKESEVRGLLRFLQRMGAAEEFESVRIRDDGSVVGAVRRWRLTDTLVTLYREAVGDE